MFEIIDQDIFTDRVHETFSVLDRQYVEDQCKELYPSLQATFEAIHAETQLLFASDWPHWDFDTPSSIATLPFLSEQAKRNILGLNAARIFNLEVKRKRPKAKDVLASRPGVS